MTFMLKKKKFKFHVDFLLADLSDVPFVNAVLFAKVRLLDGGSFCELSPRVDVVNHHVCWGKPFQFNCRIACHQQTGILEPRICRVSIRKVYNNFCNRELKGGKSYQKLGFCDVNLSEYAGSGVVGITRTYLLEGYDSGHQRQDNSLLRVNITMTLQSADPCFKVPPHSSQMTLSAQPGTLNPSERRAKGDDGASVNSASSGFESLPRKKCPKPAAPAVDETPEQEEFAPGHSRNSSQTSQQSQASGYGSGNMSHSRQSSSESGHVRRPSADMSAAAIVNNLKPPTNVKMRVSSNECQNSSSQSRIDSTRVDAGELIDELIKDHDLQNIEVDKKPVEKHNSGLQLYISKEDGSAAVVGSQDGRFRGGGLFEKVIIDDQIN